MDRYLKNYEITRNSYDVKKVWKKVTKYGNFEEIWGN